MTEEGTADWSSPKVGGRVELPGEWCLWSPGSAEKDCGWGGVCK